MNEIIFQVKGLNFKTMPMDRFAEYLTAFSKLLGKDYHLKRSSKTRLVFAPIQEDAQ